MIATTIEQSKHLLELGLDPKTADMFWMDTNSVKPCLNLMDDGIFNHRNYLVRFPNSSLPAWSLSALLEVMPCSAYISIELKQDSFGYWACEFRYDHDEVIIYRTIGSDHKGHPCPVAATYEMVCRLLEQGLIEKGGKK